MTGLTPASAKVLLSVHRHGTTTAAARALNLTQSAVSKIVSRAEESLGTLLFRRTKGGLALRPEAVELLGSLDQVEAEWGRLAGQIADLRSGRAIPLRIAATPSIGHAVLARAIRQLLIDSPDARIHLTMGDPVAELSRGAAEIGFMFSPRSNPDIEVTPLFKGAIVALVHGDDPLSRHDKLTLQQLSSRRLICFDRTKSPLGWLIARAYEDAGLIYAPFMEVPYSITAAHLVESGCGAALVDDQLLKNQRFDRLAQRPLHPAIPLDICIMTVRHQPLSQLARRMMANLLPDVGASGR